MAADAPLLSAEDFSEDELEAIIRASGNDGPHKFVRAAVLMMAEGMLAQTGDGEPVEEIDAETAAEPVEEQEEPEGSRAPVLAVGVDAELLERMDRLQRGMAEMTAWAKTVLSELYAHTGFADAETERKARAKALEKFAKIEKAVAAELGRSGNATVN